MSTRSAIIMKTESGYAGIYCHFDGYIAGVGRTLQEYYRDAEKVRALINLGDISSLGNVVSPPAGCAHSFAEPIDGVTVAYKRDRGESDTGPTKGASVAAVSNILGHDGFVYVFENGLWTCNGLAYYSIAA